MAEAYALLEIPEGSTQALIEEQYRKQLLQMQQLTQNAPTKLFTERYTQRLNQIKEAGELLVRAETLTNLPSAIRSGESNLPSATPVAAPRVSERPSIGPESPAHVTGTSTMRAQWMFWVPLAVNGYPAP